MKGNERLQVTLPEETTEFLKRKAEEQGLEPKDIAKGILNLAAKKTKKKAACKDCHYGKIYEQH